MFTFVSISHPDEIKDRKKQGKLRQHAIRAGIQQSKADRAKRDGIFVTVDVDGRKKSSQPPVRVGPPKVGSLTNAPSISLLDPFDTLCGCPERLRALMQHLMYFSVCLDASAKQAGEPIFCIEDSGKPMFQGLDTIFRGALTDPSLFHALSLVLSLAANNHLPNVEVLMHRGELLKGIRVNIKGLKDAPQVSTLTAMLLLIGYEYRIDGADSETIAAHISGVQTMMKLCKARNVALIDEVQRALFWQDLLSCLMAGTPRFLSHRDFQDFQIPRDVDHTNGWEVPSGFVSSLSQWPQEFAVVLQDLQSLCRRVDLQCGSERSPLEVFPIDNNQANIESRLVDILSENRRSKQESGPWFEASILCAYVCTYKLSTGIWMGCFIPEICITQLLRLISEIPLGSHWTPAPILLKWVLLVCGGMTDRKELRNPIARLLQETFPASSKQESWEDVKSSLETFIWCEYAMARRVCLFWKEVYLQSTADEISKNNLKISWVEK
ncbi:hypothetical protein DE146DRAFT_759187 [Phaeosphaeria sp. MPI-PUGE-AT-0046c]|nr:hypothetical protein DE146DRAFT_759187 [Phaeosphaeria sp. MPI-PUGE-AT-0046c]